MGPRAMVICKFEVFQIRMVVERSYTVAVEANKMAQMRYMYSDHVAYKVSNWRMKGVYWLVNKGGLSHY